MKNALLIAASVFAMSVMFTTSASANPVQLNCWPNRQAGVITKFDTKCHADQQVRIEREEPPKCDPKRFSKAWKPISKALKNWANLSQKQKVKVVRKIVVLAKLKKECRDCQTTTTASMTSTASPSVGKKHDNASRKGGDGNRASLEDLSIMPAAYTFVQ